MSRAVIKRAYGGVSVIIPAPGFDAQVLAEARIAKTSIPAMLDEFGTEITPAQPTETLAGITDDEGNDEQNPTVQLVPTTRAYRDRWHVGGAGVVEVDMVAARADKLAEIRNLRDESPKWGPIDVKRNKALAARNDVLVAEAEAEAQILRDLPTTVQPRLDAITDPDALLVFVPDELI